MKVKNSRLDTIRLILSTQDIGNQEELLNELAKEGFKLTQATLSRDLHQLRVVKTVASEGRYKYQLPRQQQYRHNDDKEGIRPISQQQHDNGFVSIKFSGNIAVIKTRPSYAAMMAYSIDNSDFPEILGTVAGDDTVIAVIAENTSKATVLRVLRNIIPDI